MQAKNNVDIFFCFCYTKPKFNYFYIMKKKITKKEAQDAFRRRYGGRELRKYPVVTVVPQGVLFTRDEQGRDAYLEVQRISRKATYVLGASLGVLLIMAFLILNHYLIVGISLALAVVIAAGVINIKLNIKCERLENKYTGAGNNLLFNGEFTCLQKTVHYSCI